MVYPARVPMRHLKAGDIRIWLPAMLVLLAAAIYGRALSGQFVFDDRWVVVENPALNQLRPLAYLTDAQTYAAHGSGLAERVFRPLAVLSLAVDHRLWGLAPWPYHFENVLWHMLNAWLVFLLARRLLKNELAGALSACVFLAHPVQVESVAWVAQRSNLLCAVGVLSALWLLVEPAPPRRVAAGTAAYAAALLAKEQALVFIPLLLLWDLATQPCATSWRDRAKVYMGLAVLTAGYAVLRNSSGHAWSQLEPGQHAALFLVNVQMASVCLAVYLGKIVLPMSLRASYDYPLPINPWYLLGAEVLSIALFAAAAWCWRRKRQEWLFLLWIPATLAPVLHILPLLPFVAERFLYLTMAGVALAAGWLFERAPKARPAIGAWLAFLAISAFLVVPHWRDVRSLWKAAMEAEPANAYARAGYAETLDDPAESERQYKLALTHHPSARVRLRIIANLAAACQRQGKTWQAGYWGGTASGFMPTAFTRAN